MSSKKILRYLSQPRFNVYLGQCNNHVEKALTLYRTNIALSESFYPILALFEISLRNGIHGRLQEYFQDNYWFNHLPPDFHPFIKNAEQKVILQQKTITPDRIVAELNFGFWNRLFNKRCAKLLWKPLRTIFKNMPKLLRKRDYIEESLFRIRRFRNRIYHYEPIFGNKTKINNLYREIQNMIQWLDEELMEIIRPINRYEEIVNAYFK
jgi:hypothetical protein